MSSQRYSIVEPHPSIPRTGYISVGRGGAGNISPAPKNVSRGSDASGPASISNLTSIKPQTHFTSGRGGAGNVHPTSERAIFSFDEELQAQMTQDRHIAPVYHVGRGGAGNRHKTDVFTDGSSRSRESDSSSAKSSSSAESGADVATRNIKKGWKKITSVGNYVVG